MTKAEEILVTVIAGVLALAALVVGLALSAGMWLSGRLNEHVPTETERL